MSNVRVEEVHFYGVSMRHLDQSEKGYTSDGR